MAWEICRVCLQGGDLVSLFDSDENNELLGDKYTSCSSIEVAENDQLPSLICLNCVDKLVAAYQFRQQCILSNETLTECIDEFKFTSGGLLPTSNTSSGTETIRIKRENGSYLEYDIPVEDDAQQWPRPQSYSLAAKQLGRQRLEANKPKRGRGRPRKYPNELGEIALSPYQRRKEPKVEPQTSLIDELRTVEDSSILNIDSEVDYENKDILLQPEVVMGDEGASESEGDPEYLPDADDVNDESDGMLELSPKTGLLVRVQKTGKRGRGRPRKVLNNEPDESMEEEDVLLKETIMANTQPISDSLLDPKSKDRKQHQKKRYYYDKRGAEGVEEIKRKKKSIEADEEDILLKEIILANSQPIPDHLLNPRPKERKKYPRKRYEYGKIHTCDQCGSSFRSNASLQAHIRRHLGIKPFRCSICGYSCVLNMELRRHMLRHTGLRPYQCRICDRRFGDFGSRQKHERLHLGERPYQCLLCCKNFTYSYVLANHMLTHTGEKKFSCEPCNKRFTKGHHLKYHNKVHHKEIYLQQEQEQQAKKMRTAKFISDNLAREGEQFLGVMLENGQEIQLVRREGDEEEVIDQDNDQEIDQDIDEDSEQHVMEIQEGEEINEDEENQIIYQSGEELDEENSVLEVDQSENTVFQKLPPGTTFRQEDDGTIVVHQLYEDSSEVKQDIKFDEDE